MKQQVDEIRNFAKFQDSLRNFQWLNGVAPGAMDVDCLIERKGNFLVFEGKEWQGGVVVPYGQHLALYRLSQQPQFRVYLVGEDDDQLHLMMYNDAPAPVIRRRGRATAWWPPSRFIPTTKEQLARLVKAWWKDAEDGVP